MVGKVFRERHERNGNVCDGYCADVRSYTVGRGYRRFEHFHERECGQPFHACELRKIYYFERIAHSGIAERVAYAREYRRRNVTCGYAYYERNHFHRLFAENRTNYRYGKSYESAHERDVRRASRYRALIEIAYRA